MAENRQYIQLMIEDLEKKSAILDQIIDANRRLEQVIQEAEMDLDAFGRIAEEKSAYVDKMNVLDVGFQSLFDRVKETLHANKETYKQEIATMQNLIREVTDKSVLVQNTEQKQKLIIDGQFAKMRQKVQQSKKNMGVASHYYKSMSGTAGADVSLMDIKH